MRYLSTVRRGSLVVSALLAMTAACRSASAPGTPASPAGSGTGTGGAGAGGAPDVTILPADRATRWSPGLLSAGGVPPRTTVCETVSAAAYGGGAQDATSGIQGAIDRCPEGQVVQLSAGTFAIDGTSDVLYLRKGITLRGAGAGVTLLRRTNGAQDGQDAVGVAMPVLIVGQSR